MNNYDYVQERLLPQIDYYDKASLKHQKLYQRISILNIIVTALIPVFSLSSDACDYIKYIVAIMGALVSACSSIIYLNKNKDKWMQYRTTAETLQSEYAKYSSCSCEYKNLNDTERKNLLTEHCESLMNDEHNLWKTIISDNE